MEKEANEPVYGDALRAHPKAEADTAHGEPEERFRVTDCIGYVL